jgi:hypothetical protein
METNNSIMETNNFMSLYDYLGRAAGGELGKVVYKRAKELNIPTSTTEVKNSKYEGKIILYPKSFLEEYFNTVQEEYIFNKSNDDLPF